MLTSSTPIEKLESIENLVAKHAHINQWREKFLLWLGIIEKDNNYKLNQNLKPNIAALIQALTLWSQGKASLAELKQIKQRHTQAFNQLTAAHKQQFSNFINVPEFVAYQAVLENLQLVRRSIDEGITNLRNAVNTSTTNNANSVRPKSLDEELYELHVHNILDLFYRRLPYILDGDLESLTYCNEKMVEYCDRHLNETFPRLALLSIVNIVSGLFGAGLFMVATAVAINIAATVTAAVSVAVVSVFPIIISVAIIIGTALLAALAGSYALSKTFSEAAILFNNKILPRLPFREKGAANIEKLTINMKNTFTNFCKKVKIYSTRSQSIVIKKLDKKIKTSADRDANRERVKRYLNTIPLSQTTSSSTTPDAQDIVTNQTAEPTVAPENTTSSTTLDAQDIVTNPTAEAAVTPENTTSSTTPDAQDIATNPTAEATVTLENTTSSTTLDAQDIATNPTAEATVTPENTTNSTTPDAQDIATNQTAEATTTPKPTPIIIDELKINSLALADKMQAIWNSQFNKNQDNTLEENKNNIFRDTFTRYIEELEVSYNTLSNTFTNNTQTGEEKRRQLSNFHILLENFAYLVNKITLLLKDIDESNASDTNKKLKSIIPRLNKEVKYFHRQTTFRTDSQSCFGGTSTFFRQKILKEDLSSAVKYALIYAFEGILAAASIVGNVFFTINHLQAYLFKSMVLFAGLIGAEALNLDVVDLIKDFHNYLHPNSDVDDVSNVLEEAFQEVEKNLNQKVTHIQPRLNRFM
jgi:hypothetical protein